VFGTQGIEVREQLLEGRIGRQRQHRKTQRE
jgi:hypothetical protein